MSKPEPSEWWNPLFALEALRSIKAKCEASPPVELAPYERAYLVQAIGGLLDESAKHQAKYKDSEKAPPLRADRALGLVFPRGQPAQTLSDRNIRVFNRVEELRGRFQSKSLADIFADVAEEANQGNFDSPQAAGEKPSGAYRDSTYRSDGRPRRTATSPENIDKIYRAVVAIVGK